VLVITPRAPSVTAPLKTNTLTFSLRTPASPAVNDSFESNRRGPWGKFLLRRNLDVIPFVTHCFSEVEAKGSFSYSNYRWALHSLVDRPSDKGG